MSTNSIPTIAYVTGATSQIGRFLLPRLQSLGLTVIALSRQTPPITAEVIWQKKDLHSSSLSISQSSLLFHIASLPLLPSLLTRLPKNAPLKRVIAFSSTSRLTKATSSEPSERIVAAQLKIKGARVELFFKHYNLYKNPRLKIKSSLAPFSPVGKPQEEIRFFQKSDFYTGLGIPEILFFEKL